MKRSPILQPLSREHHAALTLAKTCERAALSGDAVQVELVCKRAVLAFSTELEPHFQLEEQALLPLLQTTESQSLVQRTLAEHQQLRALLDGLYLNNVESLGRFGKCLTAHVRFEERELFSVLDRVLQERELTWEA